MYYSCTKYFSANVSKRNKALAIAPLPQKMKIGKYLFAFVSWFIIYIKHNYVIEKRCEKT